MEGKGAERTYALHFTKAEAVATYVAVTGSINLANKMNELYRSELLMQDGKGTTGLTHKQLNDAISENEFFLEQWLEIVEMMKEATVVLESAPTKPPFFTGS